MKNKTKILSILLVSAGLVLVSFNLPIKSKTLASNEKGCVFMTTFGEESSQGYAAYKLEPSVATSLAQGLDWLANAQLANGGFGAGSHSRQKILDPHAVHADPATTSMVGMALLRSGTTLNKGAYSKELNNLVTFLLTQVEAVSQEEIYITKERNTQIQRKLGANIDAILTAQFFSNLLNKKLDRKLRKRVKESLDICVGKIEMSTDTQGKIKGAGWAGVLQSGLANSALESAKTAGADVDDEILEKQKAYQKGNFDAATESVKTTDGAGIILYSVSNSVRGTAVDARKAEKAIAKGIKEGKLNEDAKVSTENLRIMGYSVGDASAFNSSFNIYNAAKQKAQEDAVMSGYGNNGGEEFLSFLQTGESLVVNDDNDWKQWYDNTSGRIIKIQNQDGSWNGHHCITSPVFCTATSLLILSIENDIDNLKKIGAQE
jgi:hypothetical protein